MLSAGEAIFSILSQFLDLSKAILVLQNKWEIAFWEGLTIFKTIRMCLCTPGFLKSFPGDPICCRV